MQFYKEENFKDSEIGKIPEDWDVKTLDDISKNMYYGITAKAVGESTILKMIRTTDIKDYKIDWQNLPYCEITEKRKNNISKYFIKKGDILISRAGTVGVSVLVDRDVDNVIFGSYLIKIDLKNDYVNPQFVYYYLQSPYYWNHIKNTSAGSTLKNINLPIIKSLKIPLPSLEEQKAIAKVLSDFDSLIETINKQIETLNKTKKGMMQQLLTGNIRVKIKDGKITFQKENNFKDTEVGKIPEDWEVVRLGDVAYKFISGGTPSTKVPQYWNGDIPWIRSVHITKFYIDKNSIEQYITKEGLENSAAKIVPKGNLIIATRVGIGKSAVNLIDVAINQDLTGIVLNKSKIEPFFLVWYLNSPKITSLLESFSRGTTIKGIPQDYIRKLVIPLPPLEEQKKIAEILSNIDKKIEIKRKEKEQVEKAKKKVMDLLLSGKVRVRT
ncbi:restriction endonuclease subunit S [Methanotorris igneus]|uniref:Restriction modification system DNA specificity domain protein n=1 Tax=Methanotorris igneus (strain DSM 5666 / JCM 11834 / Kol 5) TaxID=880724 RepID=F6BCT5_METIK|nr:restriction endonuclease subunit S [Methanotorris igneus]AEF96296.1 restriction modification system DNA specificity domain protein [Methanotorris igneus Kol 5]